MPGKTFRHPVRFLMGLERFYLLFKRIPQSCLKKTQLVDKKVPFAKYDSVVIWSADICVEKVQ